MERAELHRRVELLQVQLKNGKMKFAPHLIDGFWESMKRVKISPDGMIDPETVDGRIRSLCMLIAYENDRQEWKDTVSLREIQEGYFQRLNHAFGQLFEMMTEAKADPYKFAGWFPSDVDRLSTDENLIAIIKTLLRPFPTFLDDFHINLKVNRQ